MLDQTMMECILRGQDSISRKRYDIERFLAMMTGFLKATTFEHCEETLSYPFPFSNTGNVLGVNWKPHQLSLGVQIGANFVPMSAECLSMDNAPKVYDTLPGVLSRFFGKLGVPSNAPEDFFALLHIYLSFGRTNGNSTVSLMGLSIKTTKNPFILYRPIRAN